MKPNIAANMESPANTTAFALIRRHSGSTRFGKAARMITSPVDPTTPKYSVSLANIAAIPQISGMVIPP